MSHSHASAALCVALLIGGLSSAASAAPYDDETVSIKVKINGDDLQTAKGARALALRIRVAAAEACGDTGPVAHASYHFIKCREDAIDRAIQGLNAPMLAAALGRSPQVLARAR